MKRIKSLLILCLFSLQIIAQETVTLKGVITAASDGSPIIGASVIIKGETKGTISDIDGNFTLPNVKLGSTLKVTYIGMNPITIKVTSANLKIKMESSATELNEIVTIGYGSVRKSDLTGSVSSVKGENLIKTALTSFDQGLQGRIAGVEVVQADATPGGASYIQIRGVSTMMGSTEPLYVIDGIPFNIQSNLSTTSIAGGSDTNPLASISPSDIESIEILKDASATAIYGSQGANGVVLIQTKQGRAGKAKISFTTNQSVAVLSKKIPVLNARQYAEYKNEAYANNSPSSPQTSWDYPLYPLESSTKMSPEELERLVGDGIDWQDEIYHPAHTQEYQLSVTGGVEKHKYAFMLGYLDQNGILKNTAYQRISARLNTDSQLRSWLKMSFNGSFSSSTNKLVKTNSNDGSSKAGGVVRKALTYSPIPPLVKDENGNIIDYYQGNPADIDTEDPSYENNWGSTPLRFLEEATISQGMTTFSGNVQFKATIIKGLEFSTRLGGTYYEKKNDNYFPRTLSEGVSYDGIAQYGGLSFYSFITENLLTYRPKLKNTDHKLDIMLGMTYEQSRNRSLSYEASGFADDFLTFWAVNSATITKPITVNSSLWAIESFFGRANYNFKDRYLFTYTIRSDGSTKFARNHKWATFQSGAFAWRIEQEPFMESCRSWLESLKLRLSYGESGNQGLSAYQSLSIVKPTTSTIGNSIGNAYLETQQENPNLKWETTAQYNIGVDFNLFNSIIDGSLNIYRKDTRNLLQSVTMAPSTGYTSRTLNSGKVRNQGIEIDLNIRPVKTQNFTWLINLNWYTNKNKILDLGPVEEQFSPKLGSAYGLNVQPFIQKVGYPIGAIYGYVFDGIVQNESDADLHTYTDESGNIIRPNVGDPKFKDISGPNGHPDGKIDENDQTIIGDTNPDFFFGFNNTFTYKNFDFGVFVSGVVGGDIINTTFMMPMKLSAEGNIPVFLYKDAWRGDGTSNSYRIIKSANADPQKFSAQYLDTRTHVRIKNISAAYTFDSKKIKKIGLSSLRIGVNIVNPFTFTKYKGYDPEVSASTNAISRGVDMGNYPQARTYSFNLNCTF